MKLVSDGKSYAIKKWSIFGSRYFDLMNPGFWWSRNSGFFSDCWAEREIAEKYLRRLTA